MPSDVDLMIFMDADIDIFNPRSLESLVQTLIDKPEADVSVSTAVKDVARNGDQRLIAKLSRSLTKAFDDSVLCGQLYCARAEWLREIWIPPGLPVDDGFLRAAIVTSHFSHIEECAHRVTRAPDAEHAYEDLYDATWYLAEPYAPHRGH